jgi:hypothetical protein
MGDERFGTFQAEQRHLVATGANAPVAHGTPSVSRRVQLKPARGSSERVYMRVASNKRQEAIWIE